MGFNSGFKGLMCFGSGDGGVFCDIVSQTTQHRG